MLDRGTTKALRNVVTMINVDYPENRGGRVVLENYLELMMPKTRALKLAHSFVDWYSERYGDKGNHLITKMEMQNQPPLLVAGMISEFADTIDEALDVSRVATYAAEVIERFGWVQGETGGRNRGFCLLGALDHAIYHSGMDVVRQQNMWHRTKSLIHELLQTSLLAQWNDASGRTAGEVTHLLREVAAAAGLRIIKP